jgi:predicted deacetylase
MDWYARGMSAQYLLRFDDLCPTMNWTVWAAVEEILIKYDVRPILAVIPDNRDPSLEIEPPYLAFWDRVKSWQARGWTIAVHGHQHVFGTTNRGLFGWNERSEFAGLSFEEQDHKIRSGLAIFRRQGVAPRVWIAPNHSFDETTLDVLRALDLDVVSDGWGLFPYRDATGMLWIPMQSWRFKRRAFGVWTVCMHHNRWTTTDIASLREEVDAFSAQVTSVDAVLQRYGNRSRGLVDRAYARRRRVKRWLSRVP